MVIWINIFQCSIRVFHLLQHSVDHSNLVLKHRMPPTRLLCSHFSFAIRSLWQISLYPETQFQAHSPIVSGFEKCVYAIAFVMRVFRWKSYCFCSLITEFHFRSIFIIIIQNVKGYSGKIAWLNYQRPIIEWNQNPRVRPLFIKCVWAIVYKIKSRNSSFPKTLFHFKENRGLLNSWNEEILSTIAKSRERENRKTCYNKHHK